MRVDDRVKVNALAIQRGVRPKKAHVVGTIIKIVRQHAIVKWDSVAKAHSSIHLDYLELAR